MVLGDRINPVKGVIKPNTNYYRVGENAFIVTSNSVGVFNFPLVSSFSINPGPVWTGLASGPALTSDHQNCQGWIDGTSQGMHGERSATTIAAISTASQNCSSNFPLYCVEQ